MTSPPAASTQTCQASLRAISQIDLQHGRGGQGPGGGVAEGGDEVVALAPEADDERDPDHRRADDRHRRRVAANPCPGAGQALAHAFLRVFRGSLGHVILHRPAEPLY